MPPFFSSLNANTRPTNYYPAHRQDGISETAFLYEPSARTQWSNFTRRSGNEATWGASQQAAPFVEGDLGMREHRSNRAVVTVSHRQKPMSHENLSDETTSTAPLSQYALQRLEAKDLDCATWNENHFRRWRILLKDVSHMKDAKNKVNAINLLVDCFHRLNVRQDQEDLIDVVYDYCEPDVSFEDRKVGCDLLVSLSNNSSPEHIKRNIDVLCQLLSIIADNSDHRHLITGALRQHFIFDPRHTVEILFSLNIYDVRKKDTKWAGPCLDFFNNNLKFLLANYVEGEIELCKQLVIEARELISKQALQRIDVTFFLKLAATLRFDLTKKPKNVTESELVKEACQQLSALNHIALHEMIGTTVDIDVIDSPHRAEVSVHDIHRLLRQFDVVLHDFTKSGNLTLAITGLLSINLAQSTGCREGEVTIQIRPPSTSLPDQVLTHLWKYQCKSASTSTNTSDAMRSNRPLRDNIIATIVSLFPRIEESVATNHAISEDQLTLAEALLMACTIVWPIQKNVNIESMEREEIVSRLQSLKAMSQNIKSRAGQGSAEEGVDKSAEEKKKWTGLVETAHLVNRIAYEYLKPAEKRMPFPFTARWMTTVREETTREVEVEGEQKRLKGEIAVPEVNCKYGEDDEVGFEGRNVKRAKTNPIPDKPIAAENLNNREVVVMSIRGRGVSMAPTTGSSSSLQYSSRPAAIPDWRGAYRDDRHQLHQYRSNHHYKQSSVSAQSYAAQASTSDHHHQDWRSSPHFRPECNYISEHSRDQSYKPW